MSSSIPALFQAIRDRAWEKTIPYLICAILALTSVWISFGRFQVGQSADSLVPVLTSLQHWTPYYWEADRYGMLLALLATPFRNPLTNMMVQSALGIFAGLSCSFLLVHYYFDQSRIWLAAAALQNIWLLTIVTNAVQFDWFAGSPYATALTLGLCGVIVVQKYGTGFGLPLMLLGHWVNAALFVVLIPLVLFRFLVRDDNRGMIKSLTLVAISGAAGLLGKKLSHGPNTDSGFLSISQWCSGWKELLKNAGAESVAHHYLLLWIVIPACIGAVLLVSCRKKYPFAVAASWIFVALGYWLFAGTLVWVKGNLFSTRYIYSSLFLLSMAMAVIAISPFQSVSHRQAAVAVCVATALIFVASWIEYGIPSRGLVQRNVDRQFGAHTDEVLSSSVMLVSGNYWKVWPAVFDANLALYRRHDLRFIYGVGYRDVPTLAHWAGQRPVCAAVLLGDPEGPDWLNNSPRRFVFVQRMKTIDIYCSSN